MEDMNIADKYVSARRAGLGSALVIGLMASSAAVAHAQDQPEVPTDEEILDEDDAGDELDSDADVAPEAHAEDESDDTTPSDDVTDEDLPESQEDQSEDPELQEEDDVELLDDEDADDDPEDGPSETEETAEVEGAEEGQPENQESGSEDPELEEEEDLAEEDEGALAVATLEQVDAQDVIAQLIGDGTAAQNIEIIGDPQAIGIYQNFEAIEIENGVVLSTGIISTDPLVSPLSGPNEDSGTGVDLEQPGDADLDALVDGVTYDAAGIQFDFIPDAAYVTFSYVFGSEEYPEYVDSQYNDVFAFFVNGENYATFQSEDGETLPVTINNINHLRNTEYYRHNWDENLGDLETGLDGLTTVLNFSAPVNEGELNTIRLIIADTGDGVLDSLVFIEGGSFTVNNPPTAESPTEQTWPDSPISGQLAGESPTPGTSLTYHLVEEPEFGTVEIAEDGTYTYIPGEGFLGEDSFTYYVDDGILSSDPATVTVVVTDQITVTPEGPEPDGNTITIPDIVGVDYGYEPGTVVDIPEGGLVLEATPQDGFGFPEDAMIEWTFEYTAPDDQEADAETAAEVTEDSSPADPSEDVAVAGEDEESTSGEPAAKDSAEPASEDSADARAAATEEHTASEAQLAKTGVNGVWLALSSALLALLGAAWFVVSRKRTRDS